MVKIGKGRDQEIIQSILSNDRKKRIAALEAVYSESYPTVRDFILKNSGSVQEAEDVFQEGMTAFYYNLQKGLFRGDSLVRSYIYSICRNLWLMKLRKQQTQNSADPNLSEEEEEIKIVNTEELLNILNTLGGDCQRLLIAFYFEAKSMSQIKDIFGLKSEQIAKTKKYRCMKSLIDLIGKRGLGLENFLVHD